MKEILLFLCSLCIISCSNKDSDVTMGFLIHSLSNARWQADIKYIENYSKDKGIHVIVKNADGNPDLQNEQAKELIEKEVDVLVIVAANQNTAASIVRKANEAEIPIIAYDRLIKNCDLDFLLSFDYVHVGELMVDYTYKVKPNGSAVLLCGDANDANAVFVKEGIVSALKSKGNPYNIVFDTFIEDWSYQNAKYDMQRVFMGIAEPVDVVIACNIPLAYGARDAIEEVGFKSSATIITAQDFSQTLIQSFKNDEINMSVIKPVKELAHGLVDLVLELTKGGAGININQSVFNGQKNVAAKLFSPSVIDKSNYHLIMSE